MIGPREHIAGTAPHETRTSDRMSVEPSPLKRRLTVVLLADVVAYSRLMSVDEEGAYGRVAGHLKELIDPTVAEYGGRLVKSMGDGMLVEFGSALDAVRCGLDIQQRLTGRGGSQPSASACCAAPADRGSGAALLCAIPTR